MNTPKEVNKWRDFKVGEIVPVFHFGEPDKMIVLAVHAEENKIQLGHMPPYYGQDFKTPEQLNVMAQKCEQYHRKQSIPDQGLFKDLYTDATGQCWSDADPGL